MKKPLIVVAAAVAFGAIITSAAHAETFGDWNRRPAPAPKSFNANGVCTNTRAGCVAGGMRRGFSREAAVDFCVRHNNGCN